MKQKSRKRAAKNNISGGVHNNKAIPLLQFLEGGFSWIRHEHVFLFTALFFGMSMIFINPPWQSNDEDRHFINAYALSKGKLHPEVFGDTVGYLMPKKLVEELESSQGIAFEKGVKISWSELITKSNSALEPHIKKPIGSVNYMIMPLGYIPSAIAMRLGGLVRQEAIWLLWWARIGALMGYVFLIYFAIRIIPCYKSLLTLWALTPMALYQGASVTYDSLSTGLLALLFAMAMKFYLQENKISTSQIILFVLIGVLQSCCKQGYAPLLFCLFLMPMSKYQRSWNYWMGLPLLAASIFLIPSLWNSYLMSFKFPQSSFQNDFLYDGFISIKYHLESPLLFLKSLLINIYSQGQDWIIGCVGRFGYSYTAIPKPVVFTHFMLLVLASILENPGEKLALNLRMRFILLSLISFSALVAGAYLFMSPVGAERIFGFQGRYLLPLIPFAFPLLLFIPKFSLNSNVLRFPVAIYAVSLLLYTIYFLQAKFYI